MTRQQYEIERLNALYRYIETATQDMHTAVGRNKINNAKRRYNNAVAKLEAINRMGFWNVPGMEEVYKMVYAELPVGPVAAL